MARPSVLPPGRDGHAQRTTEQQPTHGIERKMGADVNARQRDRHRSDDEDAALPRRYEVSGRGDGTRHGDVARHEAETIGITVPEDDIIEKIGWPASTDDRLHPFREV